MNSANKKPIFTMASILALISFIFASTFAQAASVTPLVVPGNPSCQERFPGTTELKIEPVESGTFTDGTLTVTITVRDTASGQVFDFTTNIGVDGVIVKADRMPMYIPTILR